jgi:hypothetical protein
MGLAQLNIIGLPVIKSFKFAQFYNIETMAILMQIGELYLIF